jgi:chemotaxis protein MotB
MKHGLDEKRIDGVTGYADKRLRNPQDPYDVLNRRISILVKFDEQGPVKAK